MLDKTRICPSLIREPAVVREAAVGGAAETVSMAD
jgi:hypothetical protein